MNAFASLFSVSQSSEKFMKLKKVLKSNDENWEEKAVEILFKRLGKQSDAMKNLEKALIKKSPNTPCVTINRTQDGRMQINHRKRYPHFIYCKIWRWPDLKSHNELKQVAGYCSKSFYSKSKDEKNSNEVCINPYHYEREHASLSAAASSQSSLNQNSLFSSFNDQSMDHSIHNDINESMNCSIDQHFNNSNDISMNHLTNMPANSSMNNSIDQALFYSSYSEFDLPSNQMSPYSSDHRNLQFDFNLNINKNVQMHYPHRDTNLNRKTAQNFDNYQTVSTNQPMMKVCNYEQPWCTVAFFEYNNRRDKKIIISNQDVITGRDLPKYLGPNQHIQFYSENGQYFIKCNNCKWFIQSPFLNTLERRDLKSIIELPSETWKKIFDENIFKESIDKNQNTSFEKMTSLTKFAKCNLSFLYGWNEHIDISQMPCWLEIQMNLALTKLNEALSILSLPPKEQATSVS